MQKIFPVVLGVLLAGAGLFNLRGVTAERASLAQRAADLPGRSMDSFWSVEDGTELLITGALTTNPIVTTNEIRTDDQLVIAEVHRWVEDGDDSGRWEDAYTRTPTLSVVVDGHTVQAVPSRSPILAGDLHSMRHGDWRVRGFRNDDTVSVYGTRTADDAMVLDYIYMGDRDGFVAWLAADARQQRVGSIVFMGAGLLIAVVGPAFINRS